MAKLHGVNLNKEFVNPKKKQENTVKAITSGETTPGKGSGKSKGKGPALPNGNKGKGKGKRNDRSQTPPASGGKGGESKKGNSKGKPAIPQGKQVNHCRSRTHLWERHRHPLLHPHQHHRQKPLLANQERFQDNVLILLLLEVVLGVINVYTCMRWKEGSLNQLCRKMSQGWRQGLSLIRRCDHDQNHLLNLLHR